VRVRRAASRILLQAWRTRGWLARALLPLAALYGLLIRLRSAVYRRGWLPVRQLGVPVIVVGNLVVGGAGKTPTVIALIELLRRNGHTPGIVSRGYGRRSAQLIDVDASTSAAACGDEPKLLRTRTAAPVVVCADRLRAGGELLRRHPEVDVIVSDDGLQHLALGRTLQVIVFDDRGVGNGWLLPAGPLREPFEPVAPQRTLVLYNAAAAVTPWPGHLAQRVLSGVAELSAWCSGQPASPGALEQLKGRRLVAAAGIAQPQRFFALLSAHGLDFDRLALPDHYAYATLPWPETAGDVVVTEKDAVKIDPRRTGATRVWVAALDFRISPAFDSAFLSMLPAAPARGNEHGSPSA
jgi:tetraacyldisaccharide 4'-kinase